MAGTLPNPMFQTVGLGLEGHLQAVLQMTPVQTLEAPTGFEPVMEVLQTSALPLGYGAKNATVSRTAKFCQFSSLSSSASKYCSVASFATLLA